MKTIFRIIAIVLIAFILESCDKFNYSPYGYDPDGNTRNINHNSLTALYDYSVSDKDTIHFALVGDVQNFYDETYEIVQAINNNEDIEFVIQDGDITDFGTEVEFLNMHNILNGLNVPYFTVIGNHDCIANGVEIYKKVFGPLDYSFIYNRVKFIFINTNSREFNFNGSVPNINWLQAELSDSSNYDNAVVVCHVPPGDQDFDNELTQSFIETIGNNPKVLFELNGHRHSYNVNLYEGVQYITSNSSDKRSYIRISIWKDNFSYEVVQL